MWRMCLSFKCKCCCKENLYLISVALKFPTIWPSLLTTARAPTVLSIIIFSASMALFSGDTVNRGLEAIPSSFTLFPQISGILLTLSKRNLHNHIPGMKSSILPSNLFSVVELLQNNEDGTKKEDGNNYSVAPTSQGCFLLSLIVMSHVHMALHCFLGSNSCPEI